MSGRLFEVNKKNSKKKLIFETEKSAKNYNGIVRKDGGLNAIYAVDGGYTIASLTKEVERMKSELDSILSITLDESVIYAGTANGNLYAISI